MRTKKLIQIEVVCVDDPETFQQRVNAALSRHENPKLIFDKLKSFTAYIVYEIHKDAPETMLELYEMLDESGGAECGECPYFERIIDGRVKWHNCTLHKSRTREDSRACEEFYKMRREEAKRLTAEYENIPFKID